MRRHGMSKRETVPGYFFDPIDRIHIDETIGLDAHGTDIVGSDEHGVWWGTARAAWVLYPHHELVHVIGRRGAEAYDGWFVGSIEDAILYAEHHDVRVEKTESGDEIESRLPYEW